MISDITPRRVERGLPYLHMALQYAMRYGGRVALGDERPCAVATWLEPGRSLPSIVGMQGGTTVLEHAAAPG